ncbi:hypothetical protein BC834DRAFT_864207 [Gloeopeniophorella convolvens]|nr:hypothetical protein BC834DRAFT_864207 [Gloeopeniophorella convolvens]
MDSSSPNVSFIGIVDFTENARWVFLTESVSELLGYEPHELVGTPSLDLVHPDEFRDVKSLHYTTISQDKAAVLAYLRLKHKDPYKGYVLCAISRTVAWNVLVGSVSFAAMGPRAMHNASTAQEVTIITPHASNFEFRRWGDPSPMPPSPIQGYDSPEPTTEAESPQEDSAAESLPSGARSGSRTGPDGAITFDPLPKQSIRTALILDRFSTSCPIIYCSNDSFLSTTNVMGRPCFDFVARRDESLVRSWIDAVKSWGVNERGQPSDGGFGFGKFHLLKRGRDSVERLDADLPPPHRLPRQAGAPPPPRRGAGRHTAAPVPARERPRPRTTVTQDDEILVDAIFSAHSDGLMVILRYASPSTVPAPGRSPPAPAPAATRAAGPSRSTTRPSESPNAGRAPPSPNASTP